MIRRRWPPLDYQWPGFRPAFPGFRVTISGFGLVFPRFGLVSPGFGVNPSGFGAVSPRFRVALPDFRVTAPGFRVVVADVGVVSSGFVFLPFQFLLKKFAEASEIHGNDSNNSNSNLIMPDSNAATPLPENTPNLNVVPDAASQPKHNAVNKDVAAALTYATDICVAAKLPVYAPELLKRGITAPFVAALESDIALATGKTLAALQADAERKQAKLTEGNAEKKLVENLQVIQSAARTQFLPEEPAKLDAYLVGERLDDSRPLLDQNAQALINRANADRPAGLDTNFIVQAEDSRQKFLKEEGAQSKEGGLGKLSRQQRESLVKSITGRRKKIQYAADTLWPYSRETSAQARVVFKLPENRPYSY